MSVTIAHALLPAKSIFFFFLLLHQGTKYEENPVNDRKTGSLKKEFVLGDCLPKKNLPKHRARDRVHPSNKFSLSRVRRPWHAPRFPAASNCKLLGCAVQFSSYYSFFLFLVFSFSLRYFSLFLSVCASSFFFFSLYHFYRTRTPLKDRKSDNLFLYLLQALREKNWRRPTTSL